MQNTPLIELTIDEMDESNPTFCSPYVWIVRIHNQDGCAVDVDFYNPDEARDHLNNFLRDIPTILFRTIFEAVDCKLHDIDGSEAVDTILLALARYFEEGDAPHLDAAEFNINRDVDFIITTAWDGKIDCFTILASGELKYTKE